MRKLGESAILMRFSAGMPGKTRKDAKLSAKVKEQEHMGEDSGDFVKNKWPKWALDPIQKLLGEARQYHDVITLPFDKGIGILPAALVMEYGNKMREFKSRLDHLVQSHFVPKYPEMIEWAKEKHNGSFDPADYPADVSEVTKSFQFRTEPVPVPDASHYEASIKQLLGTDAESINLRVQDATIEAQREVLRRLIAPVKAMAAKLAEQPKEGKDCPIFRDTLVSNLQDIARLAPKLNLTGDPQIDAFAKEVEALGRFNPELLRDSKATRATVQSKAAETLKRLEGYKI